MNIRKCVSGAFRILELYFVVYLKGAMLVDTILFSESINGVEPREKGSQ